MKVAVVHTTKLDLQGSADRNSQTELGELMQRSYLLYMVSGCCAIRIILHILRVSIFRLPSYSTNCIKCLLIIHR